MEVMQMNEEVDYMSEYTLETSRLPKEVFSGIMATGICPNCEGPIVDFHNKCGTCGQEILWRYSFTINTYISEKTMFKPIKQ